MTYSKDISAARHRVPLSYAARPRIQQVVRVFGKYASDREITIEVNAERDVMAPLVPVSLYNGIALNLFTNALKAVTAMSGDGPRRIAFRAWNEQEIHFLEVSDTGIGIRRRCAKEYSIRFSQQLPQIAIRSVLAWGSGCRS